MITLKRCARAAERRSGEVPEERMRRLLNNWAKLVLIFVPLCIIAVDAVVLMHEKLQPETEKAIRLVRESESRKESFTVQQYLYTTVYHRKKNGEALSIEGWRAEWASQGEAPFVVEFSFTDASGRHLATWGADVEKQIVVPKDELAREMSWR